MSTKDDKTKIIYTFDGPGFDRVISIANTFPSCIEDFTHLKLSSRNFRIEVLNHFLVRNRFRMPYPDDKVVELQLPCYDGYYNGLQIPRPVSAVEPYSTPSKPTVVCGICHEKYPTKAVLQDHLGVCKHFFDYAVYCKGCKKVFVNNTAYETEHLLACQSTPNLQLCRYCKGFCSDEKLHLQTCAIYLRKITQKQTAIVCWHCHQVPEGTKQDVQDHFRSCPEKLRNQTEIHEAKVAQMAEEETPLLLPHTNAPTGPRADRELHDSSFDPQDSKSFNDNKPLGLFDAIPSLYSSRHATALSPTTPASHFHRKSPLPAPRTAMQNDAVYIHPPSILRDYPQRMLQYGNRRKNGDLTRVIAPSFAPWRGDKP